MLRPLLFALILVAAPAFAKEDKQAIDVWFKRYDELTKKGDVDGMAAMAMFPINVITTDSQGAGYAETWTRDRFIAVMKQAVAGTPKDMVMTSKRAQHFLGDHMVVVVTDATYQFGKDKQQSRYADVLVKDGGVWKFQTMAQAGWGDMLKGDKK